MQKRSSRKDVNVAAFDLVRQVTGEVPAMPQKEKNPAAVALGRLGGLKGGKARAAKLTAEQMREIAVRAAQTRWKNK